MENNNNKFLLGIIAVLLVVALGLGAYVAYDKGIIFNNNSEVENNKENLVDVILVDPSTEEFSGCPVSEDINDSKYLKIKENNVSPMVSKTNINPKPMARINEDEYTGLELKVYEATVTLGNYEAALRERMDCFESYCDANKICRNANYEAYYNINDSRIGKNKISFHASSDAVFDSISVNEEHIGSSRIYTFNDEYVIILKSSTSSPDIDDGIYIYDKNGNKLYETSLTFDIYDKNGNKLYATSGLTLDVLDKNGNLKNAGIKYTKICEGAWFYAECEDITSGEIKYDTVNKKFVVKEETVKNPNYDANFIR